MNSKVWCGDDGGASKDGSLHHVNGNGGRQHLCGNDNSLFYHREDSEGRGDGGDTDGIRGHGLLLRLER